MSRALLTRCAPILHTLSASVYVSLCMCVSVYINVYTYVEKERITRRCVLMSARSKGPEARGGSHAGTEHGEEERRCDDEEEKNTAKEEEEEEEKSS